MNKGIPSRFYPDLEAMRGIASLIVVLGHSFLITVPSIPFGGYGAFLSGLVNPQPMVLVFFVLSGFVLGCLLDKSPVTGARTYRKYLVKRVFRLVPASWFSTAFAIAIPVAATSWLTVGKALAFIEPGPNGVLWSMQVELIASAFLPFLYWLTRKCGPVPNTIVFAAFIGATIHPVVPLGFRFFVFFHAGLLISHIPQRATDRLPPIIGGVLCVAAIVSLQWLPEAIVDYSGYRMWKNWIWAEIMPATLLVYLIVVGKSGPLHFLLNTAPVVYLGRISFGVYLLHWPIVFFMIKIISAFPIISDDLIRATFVFLGTVALTVPLAAILHLVVEKPFMSVGNRLTATERRNPLTVGA